MIVPQSGSSRVVRICKARGRFGYRDALAFVARSRRQTFARVGLRDLGRVTATALNQTTRATEEISTQIASSQAATQQAIEAIRAIGVRIGEMDQIALAIRTSISQQGGATEQIARSMATAAAGTQEVSHAIGNVARAASGAGGAASKLKSVAMSLESQSGQLRAEVDS